MVLYKKGLTPHEILKPISKGPNAGLTRVGVLLQKIESGDPIQLVNSEEFTILEKLTSEQKDAILSKDRIQLLKIRLKSIDGKEFKLGDLAKTIDFGSIRNDMSGENIQAKVLDAAIKIHGSIDISIGPFVFKDVRGARHIKERINGSLPKADVAFHDGERDIGWFSMKWANNDSPRNVQQYSGVSWASGIHVSEDDETKEFVEDVKKRFPDGIPLGMSLCKEIKSESLKMHAMFGSDSLYDDFGPNKCHAVVYGVPVLKKNGSIFELTSSNRVVLFGEVPTDGYEPAFIACYRSDRSNAGLPHTRIMIYPRDGRKTDEVL